MPELPEVECLSKSLRAEIVGAVFDKVSFLRADLREPIPKHQVQNVLQQQKINGVTRRSKYMLWHTAKGICAVHLGMSGKVLLKNSPRPEAKHTHVIFKGKRADGSDFYLHYIDPRRFGMVFALNAEEKLEEHKAFKNLGPEPLTHKDLGGYLFTKSRAHKLPIKLFIMNANIVVGVGNIYASEALFRARLNPQLSSNALTQEMCSRLAKEIRSTLKKAIIAGGTTLKDFQSSDGSPGYFVQKLQVYGRTAKPCFSCGEGISEVRMGGRSTFFCPTCQKP